MTYPNHPSTAFALRNEVKHQGFRGRAVEALENASSVDAVVEAALHDIDSTHLR